MISREYPENPLIGVGALVLLNKKVLLVKRGTPPGKFKWSVPGGLVEKGETIKEAVKRELREETGLLGEPTKLINIAEVIILDEIGRTKYHYVIFDYLVNLVKETDPKPSSDVLEAKFFSLEDVFKLELTEPTKVLLQRLNKGNLNNLNIVSFYLKETSKIKLNRKF